MQMNNHIPSKKKKKIYEAKCQDVVEVLKDQIILYYITKSHYNANYNYSNSIN